MLFATTSLGVFALHKLVGVLSGLISNILRPYSQYLPLAHVGHDEETTGPTSSPGLEIFSLIVLSLIAGETMYDMIIF